MVSTAQDSTTKGATRWQTGPRSLRSLPFTFMTLETLKFVRPNKGLPLTFLVVGETKSFCGEAAWLVMEYGYTKEFAARKCDCHDLELSPLMTEQVSGWLSLIDYKP